MSEPTDEPEPVAPPMWPPPLPYREPMRPRCADLRLWCRAQRMDRTRAHFAKRRARERRDWSRRA